MTLKIQLAERWLPGDARSMFRLEYRRYSLPFRAPVRTAHGLWPRREGVLVRVEDEQGNAGFGEVAPVPGFGSETVGQDLAALERLGGKIDRDVVDRLPVQLGSLRRALLSAIEEMGRGDERRPYGTDVGRSLPVAALLPAGKAALGEIPKSAEAGFRTFKWKVGVGDISEELGLLDDLCGALPSGSRLRLDANGSWNRKTAERWLERCAERPIEFVEQPCFALRASQGTALHRTGPRHDALTRSGPLERDSDAGRDLLLGLASDFPTPIALDESVAGDADFEHWVGDGWPGLFVIKPALHGSLASSLKRNRIERDRLVFSSALETAVGAKSALTLAFAWNRGDFASQPVGGVEKNEAPRALGFGVWPLFEDARFDGPRAAPFLFEDDLESINEEDSWNALS